MKWSVVAIATLLLALSVDARASAFASAQAGGLSRVAYACGYLPFDGTLVDCDVKQMCAYRLGCNGQTSEPNLVTYGFCPPNRDRGSPRCTESDQCEFPVFQRSLREVESTIRGQCSSPPLQYRLRNS